jgi:hypothetical protein
VLGNENFSKLSCAEFFPKLKVCDSYTRLLNLFMMQTAMLTFGKWASGGNRITKLLFFVIPKNHLKVLVVVHGCRVVGLLLLIDYHCSVSVNHLTTASLGLRVDGASYADIMLGLLSHFITLPSLILRETDDIGRVKFILMLFSPGFEKGWGEMFLWVAEWTVHALSKALLFYQFLWFRVVVMLLVLTYVLVYVFWRTDILWTHDFILFKNYIF